MTLDTFEKALSEAIKKKAHTFFIQKKVDELEQTGDKWVAFVREKDQDFDVTVTIKNKTILNHSCDCECSDSLCEHVAALLYAVQAHTEGTKSKTKTAKTVIEKAAKPKKPAKPETFTELLEKVPADELRAFLKTNFARNKDFKSLFMACFTASTSSVEGGREKFLALVENTMKIGLDRNGYADWQGVKKMIKPFKMLVTQGKAMLAKGEYMDAAYMGEALMLKITEKLNNVYDVNDISECAGNGLELMAAVFETNAPQNLKDTIWNTLLEMSSHQMYFTYSNLGYDIYEKLLVYADDNRKEEAFITTTTRRLVELKMSDESENAYLYTSKKLTLIQLRLYKNRGNILAAQKIIAENLDIYEMREIQVDLLIDAKKYAEAKQLILNHLQGTGQNQKSIAFIASWKTLLRIAQIENNQPEIRRLTKALWEKSPQTLFYYRLYKNTFLPSEWVKKTESIIENHQKFKKDYTYILVEEQQWATLLERVTALAQETQYEYVWGGNNYDVIEKFDQYLLPLFPEKLTELYKEYIYKNALSATDRSAYHSVTLKLKRLANYPNQNETAQALAKALKEKYANRPAFVSELDNIKWGK